jgi:hypothetical protein
MAHFWLKEFYARISNHRTGARRRTRGKISFHPGGRIRARRVSSHSRGKTRRAVNQAGDCHRFVESAARGSQIAAAIARPIAKSTPSGGTRLRKGAAWQRTRFAPDSRRRAAQNFFRTFQHPGAPLLGTLRLQRRNDGGIHRAKVFLIEVVFVGAVCKTRDCQSIFKFDPMHGTIYCQMVAAIWESRARPLVGNKTASARSPRIVSDASCRKLADQIRREHPIGFGITQFYWTGRSNA